MVSSGSLAYARMLDQTITGGSALQFDAAFDNWSSIDSASYLCFVVVATKK